MEELLLDIMKESNGPKGANLRKSCQQAYGTRKINIFPFDIMFNFRDKRNYLITINFRFAMHTTRQFQRPFL